LLVRHPCHFERKHPVASDEAQSGHCTANIECSTGESVGLAEGYPSLRGLSLLPRITG
jgi:hypothetical protein